MELAGPAGGVEPVIRLLLRDVERGREFDAAEEQVVAHVVAGLVGLDRVRAEVGRNGNVRDSRDVTVGETA